MIAWWCCSILIAAAAWASPPATTTPNRCDKPTTLLVVRHADRRGSEDALTEAGTERAQALARALAKAGVTAIYHSDTNRTRLTAAPLAAALGLSPVEHPGKDVDGLVRHMFAHHCGETVLVVGHSNTVPRIVESAGGPSIPDLGDGEFDDLFVVSVSGEVTTVVRLEYGAPSPKE